MIKPSPLKDKAEVGDINEGVKFDYKDVAALKLWLEKKGQIFSAIKGEYSKHISISWKDWIRGWSDVKD